MVSPATRGCRFPWEADTLHFHSRYSRTSCRLECTLVQAISEVGCLPWYLPQRPGNYSKTCSLAETPKFLDAMRSVLASKCNCLPDCKSTEFHYSVTTNNFLPCDSRNLNINPLCTLGRGPLPKIWLDRVTEKYKKSYDSIPDYISSLASPMRERHQDDLIATQVQGDDDNKYNAWEEDIAVVNIFFGEETIMELERAIRMSPVEFISSLGGLFGLCLGFSITSFFEIIYWFTIALSRNNWRRKPKMKMKKTQN